jgi:hypothetical protein
MILYTGRERVLVLPDIQAPYHHADTLAFLDYLSDKYQPTKSCLYRGQRGLPQAGQILARSGLARTCPGTSASPRLPFVPMDPSFLFKSGAVLCFYTVSVDGWDPQFEAVSDSLYLY